MIYRETKMNYTYFKASQQIQKGACAVITEIISEAVFNYFLPGIKDGQCHDS